MGITYGDHLIDGGYYDITPEQEREIWAREECARRGIDPDEICADGGVTAWMVVAQEPPKDAQPHVTRYSDSSLYDEKCIHCGATDARGDDRLAKPCPGSKDAQAVAKEEDK